MKKNILACTVATVTGSILFMASSADAATAPPLPLADPQSQGISAEGIKRIDAFFADEIAGDRLPGAVLAVAKNGKLVMYKSYGYLNKAANEAMPLNAIFNLA